MLALCVIILIPTHIHPHISTWRVHKFMIILTYVMNCGSLRHSVNSSSSIFTMWYDVFQTRHLLGITDVLEMEERVPIFRTKKLWYVTNHENRRKYQNDEITKMLFQVKIGKPNLCSFPKMEKNMNTLWKKRLAVSRKQWITDKWAGGRPWNQQGSETWNLLK